MFKTSSLVANLRTAATGDGSPSERRTSDDEDLEHLLTPASPATCNTPGVCFSDVPQEYGATEGGGGGAASGGRRHSSPGASRRGSTAAMDEDDANMELAHKLSRSFDMKEDQQLLEGDSGAVRRHQSMQRLSRGDVADSRLDEDMAALVVPDQQGNLRITVKKTKPTLGIAIEGGANTKHPLPRIINIHENGAAYEAGGLEVGQLILEVDGHKVEGMHHQDVARLIAESFARRERHDIEFLVVEAKKSNLEPKPTALIFLEA